MIKNDYNSFMKCLLSSFLFSVALVRNRYKWSGSNNTCVLFYVAAGQESDTGLIGSRCWQECVLSGLSRGESLSLPFPVSRGCLRFSACSPLLHFQGQQWKVESHCITPTLSSASSTFKHSCN